MIIQSQGGSFNILHCLWAMWNGQLAICCGLLSIKPAAKHLIISQKKKKKYLLDNRKLDFQMVKLIF